jgi:hypothetical protein
LKILRKEIFFVFFFFQNLEISLYEFFIFVYNIGVGVARIESHPPLCQGGPGVDKRHAVDHVAGRRGGGAVDADRAPGRRRGRPHARGAQGHLQGFRLGRPDDPAAQGPDRSGQTPARPPPLGHLPFTNRRYFFPPVFYFSKKVDGSKKLLCLVSS